MSCGLSFYSVENLSAQTLDWESFIEKLLVDSETDNSWSNLYDDLCALHENPININRTTTEELVQLPFLTSQQIEEIQAYVYSYGPMKSLGELNLVKGIDYETRQMLQFFVYCGESEREKDSFPSFRNLVKYGKNELVVRTDLPFYEVSNNYLGSQFYHSVRYRFKYGDRVTAGFVAEKDIGEPIFNSYTKGFDSFSYYASINKVGIIKKLILGNYRLSFGQGLVLNTNFTLGKTSVLSQYTSIGNGIRPHSSTSEYNFFQGIASTVQLGKVDLSVFYSYKHVDATLKNNEINTLKEDGYHRTILELSKKGNVLNQFIGGNISFNYKRYHIGVTTAYTFFDKPFKRNTSGYRLYYPVGDKFWNTSVDYGYKSYGFSINGEWAYSAQGGFASLNTLSFRILSDIQVTLLHRYYDKKYNAIYGNAFSESSNVKNEHGLYLGLNISLLRNIKFSSYLDIFKFPYLKYGVSRPNTNGIDFMAELQYKKGENFSASIRYRNKSKQSDYTDDVANNKGLAYTMNQKIKVQLNYLLNKDFLAKTIFNYAQVNKGSKAPSIGYSIAQSIQYQLKFIPVRFSLNGIFFHTDDFSSRVFSYEQGLLYSFSIPSYYGQGYRFSGIIRYDITKNLLIQCKYGYTHYIDRMVNNSLMNIQIKYKF